MPVQQTNFSEAGSNTYSTTTQQTLFARSVNPNSCGFATAHVAVRRVSDGASKVFAIEFGFKRDENGATVFGVSLLGTKGTTGDLLALAACAATVDASSEDMRVRVTGLNAEMDWSCVVSGMSTDHVE